MKHLLLVILSSAALSCASFETAQAQTSAGGTSLVIDNSVNNQSQPKIKTTQSGWIFAGFLTSSGYRIFRSKNNGSTWAKIVDNAINLADWDIEVTGGSTNDTAVNVWIAGVKSEDSLSVVVYNDSAAILVHKTGYVPPVGVKCKDVAIATDFKNPGTVASPYSIGVALTVGGVAKDSLLLFVSNDAGNSWKSSTIYSTINYLHRISMAYGYSPKNNAGLFYLAGEYNFTKSATDYNQDIYYLWEKEDLSSGSTLGYVDSLNRNWASNIGHPDIILQNSTGENDDTDLSAMLLFNIRTVLGGDTVNASRYIGTISALKNTLNYRAWSSNSIINVYNDEVSTSVHGAFSTFNNNFEFVAGDTISNTLYSYIINFDSIGLTKDTVYLPNKVVNTLVSNYKLDFADPHCDAMDNDTLFATDWIGNSISGDGTFTLFNAKDTTLPAGIALVQQPYQLNIFPNPTNQNLTIILPPQLNQNPIISIYNLLGQNIYETQLPHSGSVTLDVCKWNEGNYFVRITDKSNYAIGKFGVLHN